MSGMIVLAAVALVLLVRLLWKPIVLHMLTCDGLATSDTPYNRYEFIKDTEDGCKLYVECHPVYARKFGVSYIAGWDPDMRTKFKYSPELKIRMAADEVIIRKAGTAEESGAPTAEGEITSLDVF